MLSDIICLFTQHNGPSTLAPTQVLENTSLLGLARLNSFAEYVIFVCLELAQVFVTLLCCVAMVCTKSHLISLLHTKTRSLV